MTNDRKIDTEDHPSFPPDPRALAKSTGCNPSEKTAAVREQLGDSVCVVGFGSPGGIDCRVQWRESGHFTSCACAGRIPLFALHRLGTTVESL